MKQITLKDYLVEVPVKPCPWCKKTPNLFMPLDQDGEIENKTWVWEIRCGCPIKPVASVSIRKTNKTNLSLFLDKIDEWFDKWNAENPMKAYEKKILDLRKVPNLWRK